MATFSNVIEDDMDLSSDFNALADSFSVGSLDDTMFSFDDTPIDCTPIDFVPTTTTKAMSPIAMAPPRMVSVESMTSAREQAPPKKTSATPYESLKNLVREKSTLKRSLGASSELAKPKKSVDLKRSATMFMKQQTLIHSSLQASSAKKQRVDRSDDAKLHKACQKPAPLAEIDEIIKCDPQSVSRQSKLMTTRSVYDAPTLKMVTKTVDETYSYPLNIAIQRKADEKTLERLINAAPKVLQSTDGSNQETPLHILLRNKPSDIDTLESMLLKASGIASRKDRRFNTPLHIACMHGAPVNVIRHLCILYPEALSQRNFNGMTPMQLCQRLGAVCSNQTVDFLWEKQQQLLM